MRDSDDEAAVSGLHPRIEAASRGALPDWARAGAERRAHLERVADLLEAWARQRDGALDDVRRWRAAGFLHDALRDADPAGLRSEVGPEFADWPGPLLHGPAVAARLRSEGVDDRELLRAVAYHTVGHPDFGELATALYCADFLDPGRDFRSGWRADLRARLPAELLAVAPEIVAARVRYLLDRRRTIFPSTIRFWNRFVQGERWAAAGDGEESA